MDKSDVKTQWHPAFCAAMRLEFSKNKDDLGYESEYNINTKPLQIDLLVIKLKKHVIIENEIGKIFKGHNLLEYKSPLDELNVDTYFKTLAYASLYKSNGKKVDDIKADDITISIIRREKPKGLFKWFVEHGYSIDNVYKGIYYVKSHDFFDIQIIVSKELEKEEHSWITALTDDLNREEARRLVYKIHDLDAKDDKEYADSVLQVAIKENPKIFGGVKDGENMCEALMELMKPEFEAALAKEVKKEVDKQMEEITKQLMDQGIEEGIQKGMEEGIQKGMEEGIQKGMEEGIQKGMEEGIQKGMEEGIQKGMKEGIQKGEDKLAKLLMILTKEQNYTMITQISIDSQLRQELYKKYGIEE